MDHDGDVTREACDAALRNRLDLVTAVMNAGIYRLATPVTCEMTRIAFNWNGFQHMIICPWFPEEISEYFSV